MSAKEQGHREFLNSLRERLNVDDKTIANLEMRITGKFGLDALLARLISVKIPLSALAWSNLTQNSAGHLRLFFWKISCEAGRFRRMTRDACAGPRRPGLTFKNNNI